MNTAPSLHRYLYAYANPTVYVDLDGYASERADEALRARLQAEYERTGDERFNPSRKTKRSAFDVAKKQAEEQQQEDRNKVEIKESEEEPGAQLLTEEEQIRRDFGRQARAARKFSEVANTTADVIDVVVTPDATDIGVAVTTGGSGLVLNKARKLRNLEKAADKGRHARRANLVTRNAD